MRTVLKPWLHYAVMCVCLLLKSRVGGVYKSPVALTLWWFQSGKGWRDCTKERNMSSIQKESYVHTHICMHTNTLTLCINVWLRLWIIDGFIICPSGVLQASFYSLNRPFFSRSLILFYVCLPLRTLLLQWSPCDWMRKEPLTTSMDLLHPGVSHNP